MATCRRCKHPHHVPTADTTILLTAPPSGGRGDDRRHGGRDRHGTGRKYPTFHRTACQFQPATDRPVLNALLLDRRLRAAEEETLQVASKTPPPELRWELGNKHDGTTAQRLKCAATVGHCGGLGDFGRRVIGLPFRFCAEFATF